MKRSRREAISDAPLPTAAMLEHSLPVARLRTKPAVTRLWLGAVLYVTTVVALPLPITTAAVLLAAFILVPLVQDAANLQDRTPTKPSRLACQLQLPAALLLIVGYSLPTGRLAGLFCLPWLLTTLLLATGGLTEIRNRRHDRYAPALLGADVAYLFVAIGGGWAFMFRLGVWPGGFPAIGAELTAVHFHFAGLVLPIIVGNTAAEFPGRFVKLWVPLLVTVTLLVAVGIALSPLLEWLAALGVIGIAGITAVRQIGIARRASRPATLAMLTIGSGALLTGMVLAAIYATGEWLAAQRGLAPDTGGGWLGIQQMVPLHGATLALGFCLPALIGWNLKRTEGRKEDP